MTAAGPDELRELGDDLGAQLVARLRRLEYLLAMIAAQVHRFDFEGQAFALGAPERREAVRRILGELGMHRPPAAEGDRPDSWRRQGWPEDEPGADPR